MTIYDSLNYKKISSNQIDSEFDEETEGESNTKISKRRKNYDDDGEQKKWTPRMKVMALSICLVNFNIFGGISIITPYFPIVALDKGIHKTVSGFVFSFYPLVGILVNFIVPFLFPVLGPKILLSGCLGLAGLSQVAFGFGTSMPSSTSFIVFCYASRFLTSLGACSCYTAMVSIAAQEFPNDCGLVLAMGETVAGLGGVISPVIGGALYQRFGYLWPALLWGSLMILTSFLILVIFKDVEFTASKSKSGMCQHVIQVMKIPGILMGMQIGFMGGLFKSVLDPVFAIFGKQVLHVNSGIIGLIYVGVWLSYFLFSVPVGMLVDKYGKYSFLFVMGFTMLATGFLLLGPSPLLTFLPVGTIWMAVISVILIGIASSLSFIPLMPYLVHLAKNGGMELDTITSGVLSGSYTSMVFIGWFVGPTISASIADYVDIRWDFTIIGFMATGEVLLLLLYAVVTN